MTLNQTLRRILLATYFVVSMCCSNTQADAQEAVPGGAGVRRIVAESRALHAAPREQRLKLSIGLPLRHQDELDELLAAVNDPRSANFHHYLTPDEFTTRFGPTADDYEAVVRAMEAQGLTVTERHGNRAVLSVEGAMAEVEQAFGVKMMSYRHPVRGEFVAPDRTPVLPSAKILAVDGLDTLSTPRPMNMTVAAVGQGNPLVTGSGPGGYLIGKDFRAAYAPGVTLTGSGQTVALLEFDGFYAGDVTKNFAAAGLPAVPVQTVLLDGLTGSAGSDNVEVILDIMMAAYMAPGVQRVVVYEGSNPNDILNRIATDNTAQQISSSWGWDGASATTDQIFKQYMAQGQSFFQASGDSGAYTNGVMTPSDDPNVTVVGGTSLATQGAGGAWSSEKAWSGSGGGVSTTYAIPSYQTGVAMAAKGGSTKMRNIPDVALTADIEMYLVCNNGQAISVGGTSAAAPLWAGFMTLVNQQGAAKGKPRVGFVNPLLYAIGEGGSYAADLHDITVGSTGFSAMGGYDLATGWGSPAGQHLINDLTGAGAAASFTLASSATSVSVRQGTTTGATSTLTLTPQNGFTGSISLAATGLPAGVTASFSPAQAVVSGTGAVSVTASFVAGSAAVAGTYPVTITGLSGSLSSTAALSVTVVVPSFTLTSSATSLTLPEGSAAATTLAVGAVNGFTGSVALSTGTLPAGITATFSPATTTSSSTLTLHATSTAAAGSYSVVVTGVSGTLHVSATVSLVVTAPNFALSFAPQTLAVPRGGSAAGLATITPVNGFSGSVSFSVAGLPAGVTTQFGAASAGNTIATTNGVAVTVLASATAVAGTYPVVLTGISGSLVQTAKATVVVAAPASSTSSFVNLAPQYNVLALAMDSVAFSGVGIDGAADGVSEAYSANLLGGQQTIAGTAFYFGPAGMLDAVSGRTVVLPAGQFSALRLLATGVNGAQAQQVFKVTYTDGTSTTIAQGLSDWFTPSSFAGETKAVTLTHRDTGTGLIDNRTFYLYEYSLVLNPAKTVASVTLPASRNVVVLAATLVK